jgi:hypothetical protein
MNGPGRSCLSNKAIDDTGRKGKENGKGEKGEKEEKKVRFADHPALRGWAERQVDAMIREGRRKRSEEEAEAWRSERLGGRPGPGWRKLSVVEEGEE